MTIRNDLIYAGRWLRDHASAFTISTIAIAALWVAVSLACITLFIWDANFYRGLAPPGMELTFQSAGIVFRLFVIAGGLTIVWMKAQKLPGSATATLRVIWSMALAACCVAALGFVTEGNDYHFRSNAAIAQTETASTETADAIIKRADIEKTAIRADRDQLVAAARQSMNLMLDDGNSKNDDVSAYETNIRKYQTEAQVKLDALDATIAKAESERLTAKQSATAQTVGDPALPAVFRAPARYWAGFDGVTFRDLFAIFWVILLEACGSVGAQALLSVQIAMSKRIKAQEAGAEGGRASAKAKMRRLITYAAAAQATAVNSKPDDANGAAENGN